MVKMVDCFNINSQETETITEQEDHYESDIGKLTLRY